MKNSQNVRCLVFAFACLSMSSAYANKSHVDNKNIPLEDRCKIALYKKPVPTEGPKLALQKEAFYRARDVVLELPNIGTSMIVVPNKMYQVAALICGNQTVECKNPNLTSLVFFPHNDMIRFTASKIYGIRQQSYLCEITPVDPVDIQ